MRVSEGDLPSSEVSRSDLWLKWSGTAPVHLPPCLSPIFSGTTFKARLTRLTLDDIVGAVPKKLTVADGILEP